MIGLAPKPGVKRPKEPKYWTYEELEAQFPPSNEHMELWNGELVMTPSPDDAHQRSTFDFACALRSHVKANDLGEVFIPPFDMVLAPKRVTQPDVMFVAKKNAGLIRRTLRGAADLVVEVISVESHHRDRIKKRDLYEQHGVKEYWMIDTVGGPVEVLFLVAGQYKLVGRWRTGQIARSRLLPGFHVEVSEVLGASGNVD